MNEYLFWQAIQINQRLYNNAQTYPYFYAGHYHKDAGNEGDEHEFRLVHAIQHYALAAQTASQYHYQGMDSTALNQHFSTVAMLMAEDVWNDSSSDRQAQAAPNKKNTSRQWVKDENAIAAGTWMLAFLDSLLHWEERSGAKSFVEILSPSHKHFVGKLWQHLSLAVRQQSVKLVLSSASPECTSSAETTTGDGACVIRSLPRFIGPTRSKRLQTGSMLVKSLERPKVVVGEMELTIPMDTNGNDGLASSGRRSKRRRS